MRIFVVNRYISIDRVVGLMAYHVPRTLQLLQLLIHHGWSLGTAEVHIIVTLLILQLVKGSFRSKYLIILLSDIG